MSGCDEMCCCGIGISPHATSWLSGKGGAFPLGAGVGVYAPFTQPRCGFFHWNIPLMEAVLPPVGAHPFPFGTGAAWGGAGLGAAGFGDGREPGPLRITVGAHVFFRRGFGCELLPPSRCALSLWPLAHTAMCAHLLEPP